MSEVIRPLGISDSHSMWLINEQGLPGTGQVTTVEMEKLVQLSEICLGAFTDEKFIGFVLCLLPNVNYSSLNYAWFNDRYDEFIYVGLLLPPMLATKASDLCSITRCSIMHKQMTYQLPQRLVSNRPTLAPTDFICGMVLLELMNSVTATKQ